MDLLIYTSHPLWREMACINLIKQQNNLVTIHHATDQH